MIVGIPIKVPGTGCIVNKLSPRLGATPLQSSMFYSITRYSCISGPLETAAIVLAIRVTLSLHRSLS